MADADRAPESIKKILVATDPAGDFLGSPDDFIRLAESYAKAGITHLVVHWPREEGIYAAAPDSLRRIADQAMPQVHGL